MKHINVPTYRFNSYTFDLPRMRCQGCGRFKSNMRSHYCPKTGEQVPCIWDVVLHKHITERKIKKYFMMKMNEYDKKTS